MCSVFELDDSLNEETLGKMGYVYDPYDKCWNKVIYQESMDRLLLAEMYNKSMIHQVIITLEGAEEYSASVSVKYVRCVCPFLYSCGTVKSEIDIITMEQEVKRGLQRAHKMFDDCFNI